MSIIAKTWADTPENKKKTREWSLKLWSDPEYRASHTGDRSSTKREITRRRMSERAKVRCSTPEWKRYWAGLNKRGMAGRLPAKGTQWSKGSYFNHPDGYQVWLRSSYELRFATCLTKMRIPWKYECRTFKLITNTTYHPDFYLPDQNLWIEVKGYMREEARMKLEEFFIKYPNENLKIVRYRDIVDLETCIDLWQCVNICNIGNQNINELV